MKKSALSLPVLLTAALLLTACAGGSSASLAGTWKLVSYGSALSQTNADAATDTSVVLGSDGKISGTVGCNQFNGDYKVTGGTITFGALASTLMACSDPLMQQEGAVFATFANTVNYKLDGNKLMVTSADGNSVVVLEKK